MPKTKTDPSSLSSVLSELRKSENLAIGSFDNFPEQKPVGLSTGNLTIDTLTGIGGFPSHRITELLGPPSSGKTTSALQAAAMCQKAGGIIFYADYERTLDPVYSAELGLDVNADTFIYTKPEYFEQGANAFRRLVATGALAMGIFDSVATMVTKHELEAETGAVQVADRAKMMHQFLRQLNPLLSTHGTAAIFLNHQMELVDATPMGRQMAARGIKRYTSPGGKALPYYASLRVEFKQIGSIRTSEDDVLSNGETDQTTQIKTQATVVKNKVADPGRTAELRVRRSKGFSQAYSVFQVLMAYGVIKKSGAWFTFKTLALPGEETFHGEEAVLKRMEEETAWFKELTATAYAYVQGSNPFEVVETTAYQADEEAYSE